MADNARIGATLGPARQILLVICRTLFVWKKLPNVLDQVAAFNRHCVLLSMSKEIASPGKGLLTGGASVAPRSAFCMSLHVARKLALLTEACGTDAAPEGSLASASVVLHVVNQVLLRRQTFLADLADEGIQVTSVSSLVNVQAVLFCEALLTEAAVVVFCNGVHACMFN